MQPASVCANHVLPPTVFQCSYPIVGKEAISNSLATAFNWICFAVAVFVVELGVFWKQHSLTVALAGILHQAWCCASES
jgi:hypothetical protein